jgi:hypothetical protein
MYSQAKVQPGTVFKSGMATNLLSNPDFDDDNFNWTTTHYVNTDLDKWYMRDTTGGNVYNERVPVIQVVPITEWSAKKVRIKTNVEIYPSQDSGLSKKSVADCLQTRPVDHRHPENPVHCLRAAAHQE